MMPAPCVAQRRHEPPDSLDYFPTPPWAVRAFIHQLYGSAMLRQHHRIWEPACGEGHMAAVMTEMGCNVHASDVFDYGFGKVQDFLVPSTDCPAADWIITNPPFNKALDFAYAALECPTRKASRGVALLVRLNWVQGQAREALFRKHPLDRVLIYQDRVPMHKGRWEPQGSTATPYAWVIWSGSMCQRVPAQFATLEFIPSGSKKRFLKPDDAHRFGAKRAAPLLEAP
jgi:hypothetical protein